ncbi:protein-L-isoaspartate O-methyltransferase family protein [Nocardioides bizhenqiangii]|uniref:Protein-L-isoaspartate O-methyltransferase n=1 Tax=Nocardioides bizhenqiangii TaxID=3095076 RepID=A0ABZ0ZT66_9ACTN|nr:MULTISPECIES: protein-L-isoaspartate O-methyltransferase [unclassified Nocardioides]MDZ5622853.1 protein-L-isoaspartate O-methyltransferase [Nocardioides sp. HM23]WQQ27111.1 protein-L-isoaspartate O-methyltransferase [Nocardioides sp. HM61]
MDEAFAAVPRRDFLPAWQHPFAGIDHALDIGYGVTNSQPTTVRNMLDLLDPQPGDRVLDVGSGSGWTTALLAHLVGPTGSVVGVERIPELVASSRTALARIVPDESVVDRPDSRQERQGLSPFAPISVFQAEPGVLGWPAEAPYDRVLVSAAAHAVPPALLEQLAVGGVLVVPVEGVMTRVVLSPEGPVVERHGRYLFVPLIED